MAPFMLIFTALIPVHYALNNNCPISDSIAPLCICKDLGDGPMMLCSQVWNSDDLIAPIRAAEGHDMFALAIYDSALFYFPKGLFKNTNFKKILLVGTQLMSLAEEDLAFEGLEESLEVFRVKEAQYTAEWTWSHLRHLQKLQTIDIEWVSLGSISDPMPHLPSLTGFAIARADISFIVDKAFQKLENVVFMVLKNNGITEMTRSMLPDPANHLISLDLSYNKLQSLPGDMFDNMPRLDDLNLENNLFTTLTEGPFSQAFVQVSLLSLKDNNIRCDCRLRWMIDIRMPNHFIGAVCAQPQSLRGRSLNSITMRELYC